MKEQPLIEVTEVPVGDLVPYARNAKIHTDEQVGQIVKSIEEFGFNDPVGVWEDPEGDLEIVEGHGRVLAAKKLGLDVVPVIYLNHLTDGQRRAYTHIHNQLTLNSDFDYDKLLDDLADLDGFDFEEYGFDGLEVDVDEVEGGKEVKPSVPFAETLDEENNYIVLKFKTDIDWINAQSLFGLEKQKRLSARKDGALSDGMTHVGIGRVVDGAEAINRLTGVLKDGRRCNVPVLPPTVCEDARKIPEHEGSTSTRRSSMTTLRRTPKGRI